MLPHERSLVKDFGDKFAIVGINSDSKEKLKQLVANGTTTWRNFTDQQKGYKISYKWGVQWWPTIYLLDKKGVTRHSRLHFDKVDKAVKELLAEGNDTDKRSPK